MGAENGLTIYCVCSSLQGAQEAARLFSASMVQLVRASNASQMHVSPCQVTSEASLAGTLVSGDRESPSQKKRGSVPFWECVWVNARPLEPDRLIDFSPSSCHMCEIARIPIGQHRLLENPLSI